MAKVSLIVVMEKSVTWLKVFTADSEHPVAQIQLGSHFDDPNEQVEIALSQLTGADIVVEDLRKYYGSK